MTKSSGSGKSWRRRWFVLKSGAIYYFRSPSESAYLGVIYLHGARVALKEDTPELGAKADFGVLSDGRLWQLACETFEDRNEWLGLIRACITRLEERQKKALKTIAAEADGPHSLDLRRLPDWRALPTLDVPVPSLPHAGPLGDVALLISRSAFLPEDILQSAHRLQEVSRCLQRVLAQLEQPGALKEVAIPAACSNEPDDSLVYPFFIIFQLEPKWMGPRSSLPSNSKMTFPVRTEADTIGALLEALLAKLRTKKQLGEEVGVGDFCVKHAGLSEYLDPSARVSSVLRVRQLLHRHRKVSFKVVWRDYFACRFLDTAAAGAQPLRPSYPDGPLSLIKAHPLTDLPHHLRLTVLSVTNLAEEEPDFSSPRREQTFADASSDFSLGTLLSDGLVDDSIVDPVILRPRPSRESTEQPTGLHASRSNSSLQGGRAPPRHWVEVGIYHGARRIGSLVSTPKKASLDWSDSPLFTIVAMKDLPREATAGFRLFSEARGRPCLLAWTNIQLFDLNGFILTHTLNLPMWRARDHAPNRLSSYAPLAASNALSITVEFIQPPLPIAFALPPVDTAAEERSSRAPEGMASYAGILQNKVLDRLTEREMGMLWTYRWYFVTSAPELLPKLLHTIDWGDPGMYICHLISFCLFPSLIFIYL